MKKFFIFIMLFFSFSSNLFAFNFPFGKTYYILHYKAYIENNKKLPTLELFVTDNKNLYSFYITKKNFLNNICYGLYNENCVIFDKNLNRYYYNQYQFPNIENVLYTKILNINTKN